MGQAMLAGGIPGGMPGIPLGRAVGIPCDMQPGIGTMPQPLQPLPQPLPQAAPQPAQPPQPPSIPGMPGIIGDMAAPGMPGGIIMVE